MESFDGVNWNYYPISMKDDPANTDYCNFNTTAAGFGTVIFGQMYQYDSTYYLVYHGINFSDQFTSNGWAWKRSNGYPYDHPVKVWFTGNRFIILVRDQKANKWVFCVYRKGDPAVQPNSGQAPWFTTSYSIALKAQDNFYDEVTLASDKVYDADNGNSEMSGEQLGDWFVRTTQNYYIANNDGTVRESNPSGTFRDIYPYNINGDSVQLTDVFNRNDIQVGERFKWVNQATVYGPSAADVEFTSSNAGTSEFNGTDATLAYRKWTLDTRASDSDPWTNVTIADDYDPAASQDGATPWSSKPTLTADTQYRVKVSYESANAKSVESQYSYFTTGPAS